MRFELLEDRQLLSVGEPIGAGLVQAGANGATAASVAFDWAMHAGAPGIGASPNHVATDALGNVYVAGTFHGPYPEGPIFYIPTSTFVAKYSSHGELIWSKDLATGTDGAANGITVDANGSVYVTGSCTGSVFFSKLDSAGNTLWTRGLSGSGNGFGSAIAVAADGSVYATGGFEGTVGYYAGSQWLSLTCDGWRDAFVAKLDSAGNFTWVESFGSVRSGNDAGSIAVANDGSIYIAGFYTGTTDLDPGPGTATFTCNGWSDIFVSKLDSAGNLVWAKTMGGVAIDVATDIAVAADGSIYVACAYADTVDFDPGPGTFNLTNSKGLVPCLVKLDSAGNFLWATDSYAVERRYGWGSQIALADDGSVYTAFTAWGTNLSGNPSAFDPVADSGVSAYMSKLDAAGNVVWTTSVGGYSTAHGIALGADQSVALVGTFIGTADFDPGSGSFNLTAQGLCDLFVLKLSPAQHRNSDSALVDLAPTNLNDTDTSSLAYLGAAFGEMLQSGNNLLGSAAEANKSDFMSQESSPAENNHRRREFNVRCHPARSDAARGHRNGSGGASKRFRPIPGWLRSVDDRRQRTPVPGRHSRDAGSRHGRLGRNREGVPDGRRPQRSTGALIAADGCARLCAAPGPLLPCSLSTNV